MIFMDNFMIVTINNSNVIVKLRAKKATPMGFNYYNIE